ncbi:hypothetical protein JXJ21_01585 [candidate division KSB1 bacterium]|nr:hypothetical protein [candidate division KSB1 bacterium]
MILQIISLSALGFLVCSALLDAAPPHPLPEKYLLLDSRIVDATENVRLRLGKVIKHPANPLFAEDKPWEVRFDNLYPNVIYDADEKLYKCWYSPFIVDVATAETPPEARANCRYQPREREMAICYATSRDGLHWEKPNLGVIEFNGSRQNNIVMRLPHGAGVFQDKHDPDPSRQYKAIFKYQGDMAVAFSADGVRWSQPISCPAMNAVGDTHNNAFWSESQQQYVGITRLWDHRRGIRQVGRSESPDFMNWTPASVILEGLEPHLQTYTMPVFQCSGIYIGLLMIFNTQTDRVHCELTWSPDTRQWHRIAPGEAFIPNGIEKGAYDWGCVYAAAYPVFLREEIRLYYGASNGPHTNWRDGFLALATLRPDGFAGAQPVSNTMPGIVTTIPISCSGKHLHITADMHDGAVRAEILDARGYALADCLPITKSCTNQKIGWRSGADLHPFFGKAVKIKFEVRNATLYSFSFSD